MDTNTRSHDNISNYSYFHLYRKISYYQAIASVIMSSYENKDSKNECNVIEIAMNNTPEYGHIRIHNEKFPTG